MVGKIYKGKKIKWGIAGCGRFAENSFLPAVRSCAEVLLQLCIVGI